MVVTKGSKINSKIAAPYYFCVTNRYASLPAFSALPDPLSSTALALDPTPLKQGSPWLNTQLAQQYDINEGVHLHVYFEDIESCGQRSHQISKSSLRFGS